LPRGDIEWDLDAAREFREYLKARSNPQAVRECVEQYILAMADLPEPVTEHALKVFGTILPCKDGDVQLYLKPAFYRLSDGTVFVLGVEPQEF
jgi:hypothetical protein